MTPGALNGSVDIRGSGLGEKDKKKMAKEAVDKLQTIAKRSNWSDDMDMKCCYGKPLMAMDGQLYGCN